MSGKPLNTSINGINVGCFDEKTADGGSMVIVLTNTLNRLILFTFNFNYVLKYNNVLY